MAFQKDVLYKQRIGIDFFYVAKYVQDENMSGRGTGLLLASLLIGASGLLPGLAWGQNNAALPPAGFDSKPIGKVSDTTGAVTIEHSSAIVVQANSPPGGTGQVKAEDSVYRGDMIQTGANGGLGIIFADGTSFRVSANARMELNEFVYDPNGSANSSLINLSKGSFTFLAGAIAKSGNMKVATPVGTMGIRGTAPHVEILEDGTVKFSTLIEEHKSATGEQKDIPAVAPARQRAEISASPESAANMKAERDLDKTLNICRGC